MKKAVCAVLTAGLLAVTAAAVFAQTEADFNVTLTGDGQGAVIAGYTGTATAVRIPARIQGMPVREIGARAFYGEERITSVVIPEGVSTIGANAFSGCRGLVSVTIPSTVTAIGGEAFSFHTKKTAIPMYTLAGKRTPPIRMASFSRSPLG